MKRLPLLPLTTLLVALYAVWSPPTQPTPAAEPASAPQSEVEAAAFDLQAASEATAALADKILRATVHFDSTRENEQGEHSRSTGSGFVLDGARGLVVTNNHVVGSRDAVVRVRLHDGRVFEGTVVGTDPATDLAVVRIPEGEARYQLDWGDSDRLRPGSWVMAVGNPLGELGTTSTGVVSGLNRTVELPRIRYKDFLQIDAYIAPGSSGGPLVNMVGEVVGINTAIAGQVWQGAGYAVPAMMAQQVVHALVEDREVRRGYLGVKPGTVTASYAEQIGLSRPYGARVTSVTEGSPAAEAGLRKGDVILAIDGHEISQEEELRARIATIEPGTRVRFKIWRDGTAISLRVRITEKEGE